MYNTYTYDLSKDITMNVNLNIIDCFEEVDTSGPSINEILSKINDEMMASIQVKPVEPVEPVQRSSRTSRYSTYSRLNRCK